ncbi:jg23705 [Pararge aegeria aegeria]|uniref:Jg23705 protein n=1 Tax=Pararge aegeria aegeria TaxID=348720 RepID=A0A8S4QSQ0_9NEOP|nr:jg23705 [Pararge aegeria aegeria]
MKKKKQKPAKIHLIQPVMMSNKMEEKGPKRVQSWGIGDSEGYRSNLGVLEGYSNHQRKKAYRSVAEVTDQSSSSIDQDSIISHTNDEKSNRSNIEVADKTERDGFENGGYKGVIVKRDRKGRGILTQMWDIGHKALDAVAEHAIDSENIENGLVDRSSFEEQRGKKKKKKKAILKLLILGAVLKAKIGTLLQILSFKLQVKFFIIALIGLGINLARFWVELKNKHNQQPQKVSPNIGYEGPSYMGVPRGAEGAS